MVLNGYEKVEFELSLLSEGKLTFAEDLVSFASTRTRPADREEVFCATAFV